MSMLKLKSTHEPMCINRPVNEPLLGHQPSSSTFLQRTLQFFRTILFKMRAERIEETTIEEANERKFDGKGGLSTMPFILGLEAGEKMALGGLKKNMMSYLRRELHLSIIKSATTLTNYSGTASLTPLIGAFVSDSFAGKFWTILFSSIFILLGLISITISATIPDLKPPPCHRNQDCQPPKSNHLAILYVSLVLVAIGSGGIRSSMSAFGADQLAKSDGHGKITSTKKSSFFSCYFLVNASSNLVAVTLLIYIQENVGWGWGFGIPVVLVLFMSLVFVIGKPRYLSLDPSGSPFVRLLQVGVAAFRKRELIMASDPALLFRDDELDASISNDGTLHHTKQLKFLDKAAIMTDQDFHQTNNTSSHKPNLWRLSTVHRVEELKSLLRMAPIWASGILCFAAGAQQNTFSLEQANTMDRGLSSSSSFKIPSGSMSLFTMMSMLITISLFYRASKLTHLQRMGTGLVISTVATLVAGFVEIKRKKSAAAGPASVFWLVPQYALHGASEAFLSTGHLHFSYDQAPESMRSTATALFWVTMATGDYVSSLLVALVHKWSSKPDGSNWLPDHDLNKGKLEWFYWVITGMQVVNVGYFLVCAMRYTLKPVKAEESGSGGGGGGDDDDHVGTQPGDERVSQA